MKKFLPGNRKKDRKPSDDEIQTRKSMCYDVLLLLLVMIVDKNDFSSVVMLLSISEQ